MISQEIKEVIEETNVLFKDFGVKEKLKLKDWKNATVAEIERYRRSQIHKHLDNCY